MIFVLVVRQYTNPREVNCVRPSVLPSVHTPCTRPAPRLALFAIVAHPADHGSAPSLLVCGAGDHTRASKVAAHRPLHLGAGPGAVLRWGTRAHSHVAPLPEIQKLAGKFSSDLKCRYFHFNANFHFVI